MNPRARVPEASPRGDPPRGESSTGDLIKQAFDEARELVRIEVGLAKEEAHEQIRAVTRAAIVGAIALVGLLLFLSTATVAFVLGVSKTQSGGAVAALVIAGIFLLASCAAGAMAYRLVPKKPGGETRRRIESDIKELKEHVA